MSIDDIEDHFVTIVTVVGVMLLIGSIVYCGYSIWEEEATAETIQAEQRLMEAYEMRIKRMERLYKEQHDGNTRRD